MIKAVLFDIDGTLLDTEEYMFGAFEYSLKTHNAPASSREIIASTIGKKFADMYRTIAPDNDPYVLIESHRHFQKTNLHLSKPYPHVVETLEKLQKAGVKMAAVTSRSKITLYDTLKLGAIHDFFDVISPLEDVTNIKPHPEQLHKVLEIMKVKPENAVIVGDTHADVYAGKSAGVKTIAVSYGFHKHKVHEYKPDYVVHDIREILPIILP